MTASNRVDETCLLANPHQKSTQLRDFDELVGALRDEILEYGELLGLLREQKDAMSTAKITSALQMQDAVAKQLEILKRSKKHRRMQVRNFVGAEVRDNLCTSELLRRCHDDARPLLQALLEQVSDLTKKIGRRLHANNALLGRHR